jgi:ribulose 1,5-bisphosphate synthetase/thiazole synthase
MLKFDCQYDVVVAGLGTAGAIAALVAGEAGLSVCGVEKLHIAGGTAVAGGVNYYYYGLRGGRFDRIDAEAKEWFSDFMEGGLFHFDAKGMVLEQKLLDAGVDILYESAIVKVHLDPDGKNIRGVSVNTRDGVRHIGCRALIDGSGNGDISAMAGAGFRLGRLSDGKCQPYSSIRVVRRENFSTAINFDAGYAACNDAADLTRSIIHSNALHAQEERDLYFITRLPGLREGRLIECDECLSIENILAGTPTENHVLAYGYANFDDHSQDWALAEQTTRNLMVVSSLWGKLFHVPITLEMLTVKGFDNLLVVGRALSVDHTTASLLRMQPCMQKSGEIAARAIIQSLRRNIPIRSINRDELAGELLASGCLNTDLPDCSFTAGESELQTRLNSDKPGEAILFMAADLPRYRPLLLELLNSGEALAVPHSALVLALGGDGTGLPVLRELVRRHDDFIPASSRSQNQPRLLAAVDLLGRFGKPEDAELLLELLCAGNPPGVQLAGHLLRSLLELGDALPDFRAKIRNSIETLLQDERFDDMLLLKNSSNVLHRVCEPLKPSLRKLAERHFSKWNHSDTGNRTLS